MNHIERRRQRYGGHLAPQRLKGSVRVALPEDEYLRASVRRLVVSIFAPPARAFRTDGRR